MSETNCVEALPDLGAFEFDAGDPAVQSRARLQFVFENLADISDRLIRAHALPAKIDPVVDAEFEAAVSNGAPHAIAAGRLSLADATRHLVAQIECAHCHQMAIARWSLGLRFLALHWEYLNANGFVQVRGNVATPVEGFWSWVARADMSGQGIHDPQGYERWYAEQVNAFLSDHMRADNPTAVNLYVGPGGRLAPYDPAQIRRAFPVEGRADSRKRLAAVEAVEFTIPRIDRCPEEADRLGLLRHVAALWFESQRLPLVAVSVEQTARGWLSPNGAIHLGRLQTDIETLWRLNLIAGDRVVPLRDAIVDRAAKRKFVVLRRPQLH